MGQHHRVIKISITCEECHNQFDHFTTRPEVSKLHKKLCDHCERRSAYRSKDRCCKNKRKEVPIVDKAIEAKKPKKFLQKKSMVFWDPSLTLRENAKNLKIGISYAYKYANDCGLKYKYGTLGGRARKEDQMENSNDFPSQQRYAWDNVPETLMGNDDDKNGENVEQEYCWDDACVII